MDKIMDMMGFAPSDGALPVRAFSGGWKMRIGLGKVLLQDPGVLMLDEVRGPSPAGRLVSRKGEGGTCGTMESTARLCLKPIQLTTTTHTHTKHLPRSRRTTWTWTRWSGWSPSCARRRCP